MKKMKAATWARIISAAFTVAPAPIAPGADGQNPSTETGSGAPLLSITQFLRKK
jgi:hypothetical protein